jgi:asparagine synthase (glutamine-hydrolysing)
MCGVLGIVSQKLNNGQIERLLSTSIGFQNHRGPDDTGIWVSDGFGFGHNRLSIVGTKDPKSAQPMVRNDLGLTVTFNGEIYNYLDLRAELKQLGHVFYSNSDTEILLCGYKSWGCALFERLNGMFALGIFDETNQNLILARDYFGEKPLFYKIGEHFSFASELFTLHSLDGAPSSLSEKSLNGFLADGYCTAPDTLLDNCFALQPGHFMKIKKNGEVEQKSAWSFPYDRPPGRHKKIRDIVDSQVRLLLPKEVPFGCFLSGGIDSSLIALSTESQLSKEEKTFRGFFSATFIETAFSEKNRVEDFASANLESSVKFVECDISKDDYVNILKEKMARVCCTDPSFFPLYTITNRLDDGIKVMLGGDGADEMFFGYETYLASQALSRYPFLSRLPLSPGLKALYNRAGSTNVGTAEKLYRFFESADGTNLFLSHVNWRRIFTSQSLIELGFEPTISQDNFRSQLSEINLDYKTEEERFDILRDLDIRHFLAGNILNKLDSCLMFNSVEGRSPFLCASILDFAKKQKLSSNLKLFSGKRQLREELSERASGISHKLPKKGFASPLETLFRTDLKEFCFDSLSQGLAVEIFQKQKIINWLSEHTSGKKNHARKILTLLVLNCWSENWSKKDAA